MLTKDGTTTQKSEKMADILQNSLETKLEEVKDILGPVINWKKSVINWVQALRNMIRGKVIKFKFKLVSTERK